MKPVKNSRSTKEERELKVLLALVDFYIRKGVPVGSNTLKEAGFDSVSSATIRNYFASLDNDGYLDQLHASGGRIPTAKAYRLYANEHLNNLFSKGIGKQLASIKRKDNLEIASFLQECADRLSDLTSSAVFLSAPRFDQDFVIDLKLVGLDTHRALCVMVTNFGVIRTEILHADLKLSSFSIRRLEHYFQARLKVQPTTEPLEEEEILLGQKWYNEVMVRYIVGYANFIDEELFRTGFSNLLEFPEFENVKDLSASLGLFENTHGMRLLLRDVMAHDRLKFWIGEDLTPFAKATPNCTVIAIPYHIHQKPVGAIGLLGPMRLPYKEVFGIMQEISRLISEELTKTVFKHQLTFRQPAEQILFLPKIDRLLISQEKK